jgi:hypothetical protein
MNTRTLTALVILIAPAATSAVVRSQDEEVLRPVEAPPQLDVSRWRADLSVPDLDDRQELFAQLVEAALRDDALRAEVREAAAGDDLLAWTSRLALRELEWRHGRGGRGWSRAPDPYLGPTPWLDVQPWQAPGGRDLFRQLEERLHGLFDDMPRPLAPGMHGRSEGFRLESTPDGVRIEVREQVDGEERVKTYEGPSLEELLEAHPELRDRIDTRPFGIAQPRPMPEEMDEIDELLRRLRGDPWAPLEPSEVPTDKLGILMRPPGQWSASIEGLDPGVGLYVERVFPGTLADALGLRPGDILVELNGQLLRGAADVKAVLEARDPGDPVRALRIDGMGERDELVWRPRP